MPGRAYRMLARPGVFKSGPGPKIDHENILENRANDFSKRLVVRVLDVGIAVLFALEGEDEAVREAFVMLFFADIRAPFEAGDLGNLLF